VIWGRSATSRGRVLFETGGVEPAYRGRMDVQDEGARDGTVSGSLLQAVIEAIGEGVVVLDGDGRVAYVSASARASFGGLDASLASAGEVVPQLIEQGGRRVPLQLGSRVLGEAIFLRPSGGGASLADRERRAILETLQATGGRLAAAARHLGISRTTLWRRLRAYGLQRKP
jgi:transcriptional regulator of acetoin/glycerol metabolism